MTAIVTEPKGFVHSALTRAYGYLANYDWFALATKYSYAPTKEAYLEQGLRLFNQLQIDYDLSDSVQVRELTNTIVKYLSSSLYAEFKGNMHTVKGELVPKYSHSLDYVYYTDKFDNEITLKELLPGSDDSAYTRIEDTEDFQRKLKLVLARLTSPERKLLMAYVYGEHKSLAEASRAIGMTKNQYDSAYRGMKRHAGDLAWASI